MPEISAILLIASNAKLQAGDNLQQIAFSKKVAGLPFVCALPIE
jgi:hypothetical protein